MRAGTSTGGGGREPLTRDRIVTAAVRMADSEGVQAVSMRALARSVGFEVMSLYNHVPSKGDLLDEMLERVAAEIAPARRDEPWTDAVRAHAVDVRRVLLDHPWAVGLWVARPAGPVRMGLLESLLDCLAHSPLPDDLAHRAFHAVMNHVLGYTMQELALGLDEEQMRRGAAAFLATMGTEAYPHLARHVRLHMESTQDLEDYEFELDIILDGLARMAASA